MYIYIGFALKKNCGRTFEANGIFVKERGFRWDWVLQTACSRAWTGLAVLLGAFWLAVFLASRVHNLQSTGLDRP